MFISEKQMMPNLMLDKFWPETSRDIPFSHMLKLSVMWLPHFSCLEPRFAVAAKGLLLPMSCLTWCKCEDCPNLPAVIGRSVRPHINIVLACLRRETNSNLVYKKVIKVGWMLNYFSYINNCLASLLRCSPAPISERIKKATYMYVCISKEQQ